MSEFDIILGYILQSCSSESLRAKKSSRKSKNEGRPKYMKSQQQSGIMATNSKEWTPPSYHDSDFDFLEWSGHCDSNFILPEITENRSNEASSHQANEWDDFYRSHSGGDFFKARKYLCQEFKKWLENSRMVLEVGCGYGCSIIPLMDAYPNLAFIGSDYSKESLSIMSEHPKYDPDRIRRVLWDVSQQFPTAVEQPIDAVLMIFCLSALTSCEHSLALKNIYDLLPTGGVLLFRDYGVNDMTMFRHAIRKADKLYQRNDGTLSYYFDLDYIAALCEDVGFKAVELKYATVLNVNRKKGIEMRRVFVHGVFQKV